MHNWCQEIVTEFKNFADAINVKNFDEWLVFEPTDNGSPHVEIQNGNEFCYVITERGVEIERRSSQSLNELMYWLFLDVTFSIASKYEIKNRHPTNDFRRLLFKKQLELLNCLSRNWMELRKKDIENVLAENPYEDEAT